MPAVKNCILMKSHHLNTFIYETSNIDESFKNRHHTLHTTEKPKSCLVHIKDDIQLRSELSMCVNFFFTDCCLGGSPGWNSGIYTRLGFLQCPTLAMK